MCEPNLECVQGYSELVAVPCETALHKPHQILPFFLACQVWLGFDKDMIAANPL